MDVTNKISAVIITYNEEKNIEKCLNSLRDVVDEIIVVDSFSSDKTQSICDRFSTRFLSKKFDGYSSSKNWGIEQSKFNFILSLDADEVLSETLKKSILKEKESGFKKAYKMNRLNFIGEKPLKFGGWYPDQKVRLFHKDYACWNDKKVHETVEVKQETNVGFLNGDLLHYSFESYGDHLLTINKYSNIRVDEALKQSKSYSLIKSIIKSKVKFFKLYLLKGGFKDGPVGFRMALNSGLRHFIEYGKFRQKTSPSINSKQICLFNTTSFWGGGEKWHFEAAKDLSDAGGEVCFVAKKNSPLAEKLKGTNIKSSFFSTSNLSFLNPVKLYKLAAYFRNNKIKTVVFNGSTDLKTGGLAAFFAGVPNIVYRRGLASAPKSDLLNLFLFTSVVTDFIVNSNSTLELLCSKTKLPQQKLKTTLIYNGISTDVDRKERVSSDVIILGIASRLVEQKGLFHLLNIASILRDKGLNFELKIAGDGPLESQLKEKVASLNLQEHVVFEGFVDDISSFMNNIDIYLCTSIFEGFGFSMAEAMLHQKPVVAFDTSSNPEVVINNKTGYIIPAFDLELFADKVLALNHDKILYKQLGENGKRHVVDSFSKEKQSEKLYVFLTELD